MTMTLHPWNEELWQRLILSRERLPQGLLFAGPPGTGKLNLAMKFASVELCMHADGTEPCQNCQACALFKAGTLPDLHVIASEQYADGFFDEHLSTIASRHLPERGKDRKPRAVLTIDQIRVAIEALATRPHIARSKIAIIVPAETMNVNAANALLKLLEEPPEDTRLILVTAAAGRLLPTIRSRTSQVDFRAPSDDEAMGWLKAEGVTAGASELLRAAGGGPLRALALHEAGYGKVREALTGEVAGLASGRRSPVDAAEKWKSTGAKPVLEGLVSVMDDWLRSLHTGGQIAQLQGCDEGLRLKDVHTVRAYLARSAATWDSALDASLVLEDAFIAVGDLARARKS